MPSGPLRGPTEPTEVWEEQLALLDRSVGREVMDGRASVERPAPLLSEMIRWRVYEDLGKRIRKGKYPPDDDETMALGQKHFLTAATGSEKAQAIHRVLIECINDLETLSEANNEMLSVEGVTA